MLAVPNVKTVITSLAMLLLATTNATVANTDNSISTSLSSTRKNIANIQTNLVTNKNKVKKTMVELQQTEENISKAAKELYNLNKTLQQDQKAYQRLKTKFSALSAGYITYQTILAKQLQLAYQIKQTPPIKLFFGEYDPNDVTRMLAYYDYIYAQQQQKLQNSTTMLEQTKKLEQKMFAKISAIQNNKIAKLQQLAKLKNANIVRAQLLASINNDIAKDNNTLALLQRDEKALELKIAQLHRLQQYHNIATKQISIPNKAIFEHLSPHMPIVSKAAKIKMHEISTINPNRFIIHATPGNKVHAIHDGKIIFAGWLRGYGLLLIIEHNNSLMSLYGHTQTIFKKAGDKVARGEVIALVGQSGGQAQPGLYFEIRKSTKSINVRNWFNYETT